MDCVGGVMYQYFVKVVPTVYNRLTGKVCFHLGFVYFMYGLWHKQVVKTNQFSVTKHKRIARAVMGETGLPGKLLLLLGHPSKFS